MFIDGKKLTLVIKQPKQHLKLNQSQSQEKSPRQPLTNSHPFVNEEPNPQQNSYIYNKYFQNNNYQPEPQRPLTPLEYRDMLIRNIIQKQKIKQMKSTKLVMPNSNINFAPGPTANLNKLFGFSQR